MTTPSPQPKKRAKKIVTTHDESPEEHVHESVDRQKTAATSARRTAATLRKEASDKASVLAIATDALSKRVQTLSDVVMINNKKIDSLQKEVNCKPDDEEVQFIVGMAAEDRKRVRNRALATALISAVVSGCIAYGFAKAAIEERNGVGYTACVATNERTILQADIFRDVVVDLPPDSRIAARINEGAERLTQTLRDCKALYPEDSRG